MVLFPGFDGHAEHSASIYEPTAHSGAVWGPHSISALQDNCLVYALGYIYQRAQRLGTLLLLSLVMCVLVVKHLVNHWAQGNPFASQSNSFKKRNT